jgi:hypothetical protein
VVTGDRRRLVDRAQDVGCRVAKAPGRLVADVAEIATEVAGLARVTFHRSASLPFRSALLDERRHSFRLVLGREQREEGAPLVSQPVAQRQLFGRRTASFAARTAMGAWAAAPSASASSRVRSAGTTRLTGPPPASRAVIVQPVRIRSIARAH